MKTAVEMVRKFQAPELRGVRQTLLWLHERDGLTIILEPSGDLVVLDNRGRFITLVAYVSWLVKEGLANHIPFNKYGQLSLTELGREVAVTLVVASELEER